VARPGASSLSPSSLIYVAQVFRPEAVLIFALLPVLRGHPRFCMLRCIAAVVPSHRCTQSREENKSGLGHPAFVRRRYARLPATAQGDDMEVVFISVPIALGVAAFATMASIVRDIFPSLSEQERESLRDWLRKGGYFRIKPSLRFSRALKKAWNEHIRLYPSSRKRLLFACLFVAVFLSIMAEPVWLALAK